MSSPPLVGVASSGKRKIKKNVSFRRGLKKGVSIAGVKRPSVSGTLVSSIAKRSEKNVSFVDSTSNSTENDNDIQEDQMARNETNDNRDTSTTMAPPTRRAPLSTKATTITPRPKFSGGSSINKVIPGGKRKSRGNSIITLGANRTPTQRRDDLEEELSPTTKKSNTANDDNNYDNNDGKNEAVGDVKSLSSNNTTLQHALSTTFSSSVGYIRNSSNNTPLASFDKEKELTMVPYQFLGKLDPSWNIPAPKTGEKTMIDFCSKFPKPKKTRTKNDDPNAKDKKVEVDEVTSVVTSSSSVKVDKVINRIDDAMSTNSHTNKNDGPAVEIINGEIVIKQSSITINSRKTTKEIDEEYLNDENALVVEDNNRGVINATYRSFLKEQPKSGHWHPKETHKFYNVLRQCGTDFSMMTNFFPNRNRKQLKKKYLIESRKNPKLIDMAMNPNSHIPLDTSVFGELDMTTVADVKAIADHQISNNLQDTNIDSSSKTETNDIDEKKELNREDGMEVIVEEGDGIDSDKKTNNIIKDQKDNPDQQQPSPPPKKQTIEELFDESENITNTSTSKNSEVSNSVNNESQKEITGLEEGDEQEHAPMTLTLMGGGNKSKKTKARPKFKVKAKRPSLGGPSKAKQKKR